MLTNSVLFSQQVLINEFLARNETVIPDNVDFGDYSDWLELYNPTNTTVDLTGYYLTDDLNEPLKWEIPAGTIIRGYETILFWADGYDAYPGQTYTRDYSPWNTFRTKRFHTNFKLDFLGEEIGLFKSEAQHTFQLITGSSEWKYLDDGSDQGDLWTGILYDDSMWKSGFAQLGYGDGDEVTTVSFGGNSSDKFITTYLRKHFAVENLADISNLSLSLIRDDGAVIYLNGNEVVRTNMPSGRINYMTPAESAVSGAEEDFSYKFNIPVQYLNEGENIIAVEIHQVSAQSSDISFDMELIGQNSFADGSIKLVDSVTYYRQIEDVSLGRNPEDNLKWYYYGEPTPGRINFSTPTLNTDRSGNVSFSLDAGFYSGSQILQLTSENSSDEIYYTIDGSLPTTFSHKYTAAITLNKNTVVRARTFSSDKLPGKIKSASYFIDEKSSTLSIVSLIVDPSLFWDDEIGIYSNILKGREMPLSLEYYKPDGTKIFQVSAGVKIGGYNIWRFAQKPLNLYLKNSEQIEYKLFDKPIASFTSLSLRNGGDNWPTTMLPDAMAESIVSGQMNVGVQAYKPCIVYINGEYWGIHNLRERFDENYFAENFNADPYNIDHIRYNLFPPNNSLGLEVEKGSLSEYNSLIDFVETHDLSLTDNYNFVKSNMDIDNFIDFISAEVYVCNSSWRHNREWWKSTNNGGRWQWLLPDIDRGFFYGRVNSNVLDDMVEEYSLFYSLLDNSNFKNKFIQRFAAHLNSTFSPNRLNIIADSLSAVITPEMQRHTERWGNEGGIGSVSTWISELNLMRMFIDERNPVVFNQLMNEFGIQEKVSISISVTEGEKGGVFYFNGVPMRDSLSGLSFFKDIPVTIVAVPNPGYRFGGWHTGVSNDTLIIVPSEDTILEASFMVSDDILLPSAVNTDLVLDNTDLAYITEGDLKVLPNSTLRIKKGVEVILSGNASIYVEGRLIIEGTAAEPVVFKPHINPQGASWGALCFINSTDTSFIKHLNITGASIGVNPVSQKGAVSSFNSNIVIEGLNISDVPFPVYIEGGSIDISHSTLSANSTCDYIGVKRGNAVINNNIFYGNSFPDTDGIDLDGDADAVISNNRFYNFSGFNCDAIDIGEESKDISISGNIIYASSDKGISVGQNSNVNIERNVIVGCNLGVAVKDESEAVIKNNTFFMNNIAVSCYEKNFGRGGGHATITNSIISASKQQSIYFDELSSIDVSYSLSDMDNLPGINNLYNDPGFIDELNYNLELTDTSKCNDAGLNSNSDVVDIGAYYIYSASDIPIEYRKKITNKIVINEIMYNGDNGNTRNDWIELYNNTNETINLSSWKIIDEDTTHIFEIPTGIYIDPGKYLIICSDTAAFKLTYNNSEGNYIGNFEFGLGGKDAVNLMNSEDELINFVSYSDTDPWPNTGSNSNVSIELINPDRINYLTINWNASVSGGTPGRQNDSFIAAYSNYEPEIPETYGISQNYPNPFNPSTIIEYDVAVTGLITVSVYNILGEKVAVLTDEVHKPGRYRVEFNTNTLKDEIASGIYIYRIVADKFSYSRKMILLK